MKSDANIYGLISLRRNAAVFLFGRFGSAALSLLFFVLAAKVLSTPVYGGYMATLAAHELLLALSTGGLDWVATRTIPEYRQHASGVRTVRLVRSLSLMQIGLSLIVAILFYLFSFTIYNPLSTVATEQATLFLCVMVLTESASRIVRDQILGILMRQREAQTAQLWRAGLAVGFLVYSYLVDLQLGLIDVLTMEVAISTASLLIGLWYVRHEFIFLRTQPAQDNQWQPPERSAVFALARHSYFSYLLSLLSGPYVVTLLIARFMGADGTAVFGFARGFSEQIRRYLPTELLQTVVRPVLVGHYARTGQVTLLTQFSTLWLKASILTLLPILFFFSAFGDIGVRLLVGDRFPSAGPVIAILLCFVAGTVTRRSLELICNTILAAHLCTVASLALLILPPALYALLQSDASLHWICTTLCLGEFMFSAVTYFLLRKSGHDVQIPLGGFLRLYMVAGAFIAAIISLQYWEHWNPGLMSALLASTVLPILAIVISKPFSVSDIALTSPHYPRLARLMNKQV